jgi:hypothetical protein
MLKLLIPLCFLLAGAADVQRIAPGRWDVTSTAVDLSIPGVPGFMLRMMKGKSKAEHKCVTPDQATAGIAALLAPDPKAQCRVDSLRVADGRYAQALSCPQKQGPPIQIDRSGSYSDAGFSGRLQMAGVTSKGAMRMTLDQTARRIDGVCKR